MLRKFVGKIRMSALMCGFAACMALTPPAAAEDLTGKIYFIMPDFTTVRFEQFDKPAFLKAANELVPNMTVDILNSENNVQQQTSQVQAAIANDAKAIVMVAVDPMQTAGTLALAEQAGIPLICTIHACTGGPAYAYLTAPFVEIGQKQAQAAAKVIEDMNAKTGKPVRLAKIYGDPKFPFYGDQVKGIGEYLDPLIKAGKLEVVCQADALLWLPANAQTAMDQCLTKTHNGVDAIFSMNDDTGGAALAAVEAAGLKGIKLFGGYDATLAGVQRVAAGLQEMDMTVDYVAMNKLAVQLAVHAMKGEKIPANLVATTFDNGYKGGIPEVDAPNSVITKDNIQKSVVDTGLYTKEQICAKGVAADSAFCRG
ncbi:MAG: hypothetical protein E5X22_24325 [Mesorhizobium sp.]|nr:MAG: hypothetical protein EOQ76_31365 [Mesorhizobium sp.]RWH36487.1 MAG: hypothetical protein EOQ79_17850 [Mesorhizobium sp.]TIR57330.1 MAG: hypothetical protein E5X22_24325 [Mesorhizobium sp.]TIR65402.1 MAG: hypothetical protein E5X24_26835 [Mesorhizobium sp.]